MPPATDPLLGRVIAGKLELLDLLGSGACGKVYRARHRGLDKIVAIKVLHRADPPQPDIARRFQAEARAASRLDHPNSLRILDFGEDGPDGLLYLAMEFLEGEDLNAVLRREGPLEAQRIAEIMVQVLAALAIAHQQGVVHRDMKPGNIMLLPKRDDGGVLHDLVKVCDFGLAKILDVPPEDASGAPLTKQGSILGTPAYMSPEQASGDTADGLTDIYACGVILYHMLTGRTPFTADSMVGILLKHISEPPTPILSVRPTADPQLAAIAHRAMAKAKSDRYPSAREMMIAIRAVLSGAQAGEPWSPETPPAPRAAPAAVPASEPRLLASIGEATSAGSIEQAKEDAAGNRWTLVGAIAGSIALFLAGIAVALVVGRESPQAIEVKPLEVAERVASDGAGQRAQPNPSGPGDPAGSTAQAPSVATNTNAGAASTNAGAASATPPNTKASNTTAASASAANAANAANAAGAHGPRGQTNREATTAHAPPKSSEATAPSIAEPTAAPPPAEPAPETAPAGGIATSAAPLAPAAEPTPPPAEKAPAEKAPAGPAKLAADFRLDVALAELEVTGGLSTNRSTTALERYVAAAKGCLLAEVKRLGVETSGEVKVGARIDQYGALRDIHAAGPLPKAEPCIAQAFAGARMPKPDTGDARIAFRLRYRAGS